MLGANEGMTAAFRSLLAAGDGVVVMQPYHELYPSQAAIFGLVPLRDLARGSPGSPRRNLCGGLDRN